MTQAFQIGDRARVKQSMADTYVQPWRARFEKGRCGTVLDGPSPNVRGYLVEWDHGKVKYPQEWFFVIRKEHLEPAP